MHSIKPENNFRDNLLVFLLSYNFSLSYGHLLKLYLISPKLFWAYITTFSPLLKVGSRKLSLINTSASNITDFFHKKDVVLNEEDSHLAKLYQLFIPNYFCEGDTIYSIKDLEEHHFNIPDKRFINILDAYSFLSDNYNLVDYIIIKDKEFNRVARYEYLMNKYFSDLGLATIDEMSVPELLSRIESLK